MRKILSTLRLIKRVFKNPFKTRRPRLNRGRRMVYPEVRQLADRRAISALGLIIVAGLSLFVYVKFVYAVTRTWDGEKGTRYG